MRTGRTCLSLGFFLVALGVYLLSGPGRIDIIDGQIRFEVAKNWLDHGVPELLDPAMRPFGSRGTEGRIFAQYNAGASASAIPLIAAGEAAGDGRGELQRFLFSLTGAFFGAGVIAIVALWLVDLGLGLRRAASFAALAAFGSYLWPLACTTFDQIQHAFFLTFALYAAWRAGREDLGRWALASGVAVGLLLNYQENYLLLWPAVALLLCSGRSLRDPACQRLLLYHFLPLVAGVAVLFEYNRWRFGVAYFYDRAQVGAHHPPLLGNPIVGLPSLLLSPGKSIFLYSPSVALGLLGWRRLRQESPHLARSLVVATAAQTGFIACLSFFGSDWAWGSRYLGVLLGLWILPAAFWRPESGASRRLRAAIVVASIGVQILGLSLDANRFFIEHRLPSFFWYSKPWYYMSHSALFSRPGEILRSFEERENCDPCQFSRVPYPGTVTYLAYGSDNPENGPEWLRGYGVYFLPRPWPFWMRAIPPDHRPWGTSTVAALALTLASLGGAVAFQACRERAP